MQTSTITSGAPIRSDPLPGRGILRTIRLLSYASAAWLSSFAALQAYWAIHGRPWFPPQGYALVGIEGWPATALCGLGVLIALVLGARPGWGPVRTAIRLVGALTAAGLGAASCVVVIDIVGVVFPGLGLMPSPGGSGVRAAGVIGAGLLGVTTLLDRRRERDACGWCGRTDRARVRDLARPPLAERRSSRFVLVAGYVAVLGCLTRFGIQAWEGFGAGSPLGHESAVAGIAFLAAMLLAGTLLPLALVHGWGRIWPFWVPLLARRAVPRWVVLVPAFLMAGGLLLYFGTGSLELLLNPATAIDPILPGWFVPVAVSGYLLWGSGLAVGARSYFRLTRPDCPHCMAAGQV